MLHSPVRRAYRKAPSSPTDMNPDIPKVAAVLVGLVAAAAFLMVPVAVSLSAWALNGLEKFESCLRRRDRNAGAVPAQSYAAKPPQT